MLNQTGKKVTWWVYVLGWHVLGFRYFLPSSSAFLIMSFILINNLLIFFLYYITLPVLCFQGKGLLSIPPLFARNTKWPRKRKWKFKLSDEILADIAYGFNNEEKCYVLRISQGFENKRIGGAHDWYDAFALQMYVTYKSKSFMLPSSTEELPSEKWVQLNYFELCLCLNFHFPF